MTAEVALRPATLKDWETAQAWLSAEGLPTDDLGADDMQSFLIAADDKRPLGMIGLEMFAGCGLLRSLVVDREARGLGLGARLVKALEARARLLGVKELWLLTIDADGFFLRLGYEVAARPEAPPTIQASAEFASLCPGDAVLMRKKLF